MKKLTPSQNRLIKQTIVLILILALSSICLAVVFTKSGYVTRVGNYIEQPVPFSHQTHVDSVGLDCRFCHSGKNVNGSMNIPSMETCYGCHRDVLNKSDFMKPVREGYTKSEPIVWERVNKLANHVHFQHEEHIKAGVQCSTCHGDVGNMPLMTPEHHFAMQFCIDCHREKVGPRLTDCFTCHR